MPKVKVNFFATLRPIVGQKTVEVDLPEGATVRDLAETLVLQYPALREHFFTEDGRLHHSIHILLDGRDFIYLPKGEGEEVTNGAKIDIFPPVGGG